MIIMNLIYPFPTLLLSVIASLTMYSCGDKMAESVPYVIFDTDMGSDCDDAGALALLHYYENEDKIKILGCIYSSGKVPYGAAIIEAINIYYGKPGIPIGAAHDTLVGDPEDKMSAAKLALDQAAFNHKIIHNTDAPEQTLLNRILLSEAEDNSVIYLTVGHTKGLYDLLTSKPDLISPLSGYDLAKQKIKRWVALGALNAANSEGDYVRDWNFAFNGTTSYTHYTVNNFPGEIVFIDAGNDVYTGKSLMQTPPGNIVRTIYRDWLWNVYQKPLEHQRPSWDLAAVYYTVEGTGMFLEYASPGRLLFDSEKGSKWEPMREQTNHRFVLQKKGVDNLFEDYLNVRLVKE